MNPSPEVLDVDGERVLQGTPSRPLEIRSPLVVRGSGRLRARFVRFLAPGTALRIEGDLDVRLEDCSWTGNAVGLAAIRAQAIRIARGAFRRCGHGLVAGKLDLRVRDSVFVENAHGMALHETNAEISACSIEGGDTGVSAKDSAPVFLRTRFERVGLGLWGSGGKIRLEGATWSSCTTGIQISERTRLDLGRCDFDSNRDAVVVEGSASRAAVSFCRFRNNVVGARAGKEAVLTISSSLFRGHSACPVVTEGTAFASVRFSLFLKNLKPPFLGGFRRSSESLPGTFSVWSPVVSFVERTRRWPGLASLYKGIYAVGLRAAVLSLLRIPGIELIYLCRSGAREALEPGLSDLDLAAVFADRPAPEGMERWNRLRTFLPFLGEIRFFSREEFRAFRTLERLRSREEWSLLHGIERAPETARAPDPLPPGEYLREAFACYAYLNRAFFRGTGAPRNKVLWDCWKSLEDIRRYCRATASGVLLPRDSGKAFRSGVHARAFVMACLKEAFLELSVASRNSSSTTLPGRPRLPLPPFLPKVRSTTKAEFFSTPEHFFTVLPSQTAERDFEHVLETLEEFDSSNPAGVPWILCPDSLEAYEGLLSVPDPASIV